MDGNKMPWGESIKLECSSKHEGEFNEESAKK